MTTAANVRHYHVVAGRSEGINVPTLDDARQLAASFSGMTVRVWAVTDDGSMDLVLVTTEDYATEVIG
jgi:phosphoketolase